MHRGRVKVPLLCSRSSSSRSTCSSNARARPVAPECRLEPPGRSRPLWIPECSLSHAHPPAPPATLTRRVIIFGYKLSFPFFSPEILHGFTCCYFFSVTKRLKSEVAFDGDCPFCDKQFRTVPGLKAHISKCHQSRNVCFYLPSWFTLATTSNGCSRILLTLTY